MGSGALRSRRRCLVFRVYVRFCHLDIVTLQKGLAIFEREGPGTRALRRGAASAVCESVGKNSIIKIS
jgi:hypothetical protein